MSSKLIPQTYAKLLDFFRYHELTKIEIVQAVRMEKNNSIEARIVSPINLLDLVERLKSCSFIQRIKEENSEC